MQRLHFNVCALQSIHVLSREQPRQPGGGGGGSPLESPEAAQLPEVGKSSIPGMPRVSSRAKAAAVARANLAVSAAAFAFSAPPPDACAVCKSSHHRRPQDSGTCSEQLGDQMRSLCLHMCVCRHGQIFSNPEQPSLSARSRSTWMPQGKGTRSDM